MAFPADGITTAVTPGMVLRSGPDGAHAIDIYEYLSTTTGDSGTGAKQPRKLKTFVLSADETDAFYTALGHS